MNMFFLFFQLFERVFWVEFSDYSFIGSFLPVFQFFDTDFHLLDIVTASWSAILSLHTNTLLVSCCYITICCHNNLTKMAHYFKTKLSNSWHSLNLCCKSLYSTTVLRPCLFMWFLLIFFCTMKSILEYVVLWYFNLISVGFLGVRFEVCGW